MRKTVTITAIALLGVALAGCSKPAPAPEASTAAMASDAAMAPTAAAGGVMPSPGKYEAVSTDGKTKTAVTINSDGGYRMSVNGALPVSGLIKMVDGKTCFDPSGPKEATCYLDSPHAADGTFTATSADGSVEKVKPVAK
jgi:hypothetical protein